MHQNNGMIFHPSEFQNKNWR